MENLRGLGDIVFTEVLDDIYVRVLILGNEREKILFVVFDLDKVPYPERYLPMLSKLTGIPESGIAILSIHTHTAPVTGWRPTEGPNFILRKPERVQQATHLYENYLENAVQEAVKEALAAQQPVRIGWSVGESYVNINRLQDYIVRTENGETEIRCGLGQNPAAPVDRSLFVLKAESLDGKMVACLTNYAVHNCVLIGNRCGKDGGALLSSDLGGNVSRMIEENFPGSVALWTSGAAGDVNPVLSNEIFYPDPKTGEQTAYILPPGDEAPRMMLKVLAARHLADVLRVLEQISCGGEDMDVGGMVKWAEMPGKGEEPYKIRVHLTRIGDLGLWGVSGELYSSLGKAVTQALPGGPHFILNHDASLMTNTGYIYDDETLARDREETLPGRRNNEILPGYAKESLLTMTSDMWNLIDQESEEE
ncbi:MAG: hypothetical protein ACI4O3_06495 [Oscillospiraceae bacterium]